MALGFLKKDYNSVVLPYDDEKTPLNLTGLKMLPIFDFGEGTIINESLDIISKLDSKNALKQDLYFNQFKPEIELFLDKISNPIHSLCMPYWIFTPEFNEKSRHYFQRKKEKKRGPFYLLIKNQEKFLNELLPLLSDLEQKLGPFYKSEKLTLCDIIIASQLWGLYIFPEFQFSDKIHRYLQTIKEICQFNYHEDFWKGDEK